MNPACQIRLEHNRIIAHSEETTKEKKWKLRKKKEGKYYCTPDIQLNKVIKIDESETEMSGKENKSDSGY